MGGFGMSDLMHWKARILRDLATINYGRSPSKILADDGEYPVVGTGGSERKGTHYIYDGESIILGRKGTIDRVGYMTGKFWAIDTAYYLTEFGDSIPLWLFYFFQTLDLRQMNEATGVPSISRELLYKIEIPTPPKPEQTKIAEILSTVDRAIEQTEALIAKQQRLKTGLMQDLLTRGIDEHGNLRSEETHEFKNSPLGRIPVEWEVRRIDELLAKVDPPMRSGPFGSALLKEELVESGIPLLGIDNVHVERFVSDFTRFVEPKKAKSLKRYLVRPGDIMITIMGTVGRSCVVPDDIGPALSSKHTWTISVDPSRYSPYLACLQVNHASWVLQHFAQGEQGGIMASIKADTLRSTLLPVPPPDEMLKIESLLKAVSAKISVEQDNLEKNRAVKTALMQDLLTGRKRILASSGELSARNQKVKINE